MSTSTIPPDAEESSSLAISARPAATANPFKDALVATNAATEIESQRAIAEIQAAIVVAQRFPRNQAKAFDRIVEGFTRPILAEKAVYEYAKGGQAIVGASIRAAEEIARGWGNMSFGVRELSQKNGMSEVEAFAWDLETNIRSMRTFQVTHIRHTKKGSYRLEDPRDIYELVANNGARRMRACILQLIPGDVVEAALDQAKKTQATTWEVTPEKIAAMIARFAEIGVPKSALEKRIQRNVDRITPGQLGMLGRIFQAIDDGMTTPEDNFEIAPPNGDAVAPDGGARADRVAARVAGKNGGNGGAAAAAAPAEGESPGGESKTAPAAGESSQSGIEITGQEDVTAVESALVSPLKPDQTKARSLRSAILTAWGKGNDAQRSAALTRLYAKNALPDLTVAQLEEFLEQTPELLKAAGIAQSE